MPTKQSISQMKYDKANTRYYGLKLNLKTDADIINKLSTVESFQGYIKKILRADANGDIMIHLSPAALEMLKEKAEERGITPENLASVIISEQFIRT